jgi:hypothetical protein
MCIDEEVYKRVRPARIREILTQYYASGNGGRKAAARPKKAGAAPAVRKTPVRKAAGKAAGKAPRKVKVGAAKGARRG